MELSMPRSRRPLRLMMIVLGLICFVGPALADEWEGRWAQDCKASKEQSSSIELSRKRFDLDLFEMGCTPLGVRKIGSKYIVDLSCEGEEGADRKKAQLEVKNGILNISISGFQADFGVLHRCDEKAK